MCIVFYLQTHDERVEREIIMSVTKNSNKSTQEVKPKMETEQKTKHNNQNIVLRCGNMEECSYLTQLLAESIHN